MNFIYNIYNNLCNYVCGNRKKRFDLINICNEVENLSSDDIILLLRHINIVNSTRKRNEYNKYKICCD